MSTSDDNAMYLNLSDKLESMEELYKQGWIGTDDFRSFVQLMTDEDLSNASINEMIKNFEEEGLTREAVHENIESSKAAIKEAIDELKEQVEEL